MIEDRLGCLGACALRRALPEGLQAVKLFLATPCGHAGHRSSGGCAVPEVETLPLSHEAVRARVARATMDFPVQR